MDPTIIFSLVLATSLALLMAQVAVRHKTAVHLCFAVFCGSIAMMAAQQLSADKVGAYQYLIGLGACATCNGFWLVARAMFRAKNAIAWRHLALAASVASLIACSQGLQFIQESHVFNSAFIVPLQAVIGHLVALLSSGMLLLTCWEGCRGLSSKHGAPRWQALIFVSSYALAVLSCMVLAKAYHTVFAGESMQLVVNGLAALLMLIVTQGLIIWQHSSKHVHPKDADSKVKLQALSSPPCDAEKNISQDDLYLGMQIKQVIVAQRWYLESGLKVADIARQFNVSEYRVSRVLREQLNARNFNQFINALRIQHAKSLLEDPKCQHWPVLVIGLESGFASVGPFNRAFKATFGTTPNEYRLSYANIIGVPVTK
jgi:AraC-like DNA-binding protein